MTAKEFLGQAYRLDQRINSKLQQIESLRSLTQKVTQSYDNEVVSRTRNVSSLEDAIIRLMEAEEELNRQIDQLIDTKIEIGKLIPLPYVLACEALERLRTCGAPCLRPDAKCQVTFDYGKRRIDTFLISTQHTEDVSTEDVHNIVLRIMKDTAKQYGLNTDFKALINPTGRFVIGGSFADTGVTGRKIIADTYGGVCRHGGGAFSGKDPTKVDRSAAYMARKIAKDIVRAHLARRVEVQLAYAIGVAEPVSISVDCFGTNHVPKRFIVNWIRRHYDLTPAGIISFLGLRDVDYNMVSYGGHFRRSWMPWEK